MAMLGGSVVGCIDKAENDVVAKIAKLLDDQAKGRAVLLVCGQSRVTGATFGKGAVLHGSGKDASYVLHQEEARTSLAYDAREVLEEPAALVS